MSKPAQIRCPIFGDMLFNPVSPSTEANVEGNMRGNMGENMGRILDGIGSTTKVYEKGDIVARQGDTCKGLYLLTKGSVKTEMINETGGVLSIEKINAVKPLAPAFIFAKVNVFPVDVIATEKSEILFISKEDILKLFQRDTNFMERYIQYNANKTQFLSDKLQMLTIKTIRGKLAHYIMGIYYIQKNDSNRNDHKQSDSQQSYYKQSSSQMTNSQMANSQKKITITLDKNQTELAKFFGVTRPSLARILHEMEVEGLISVDKKQIQILDMNGLKEARG